jgi:hypothetical protein
VLGILLKRHFQSTVVPPTLNLYISLLATLYMWLAYDFCKQKYVFPRRFWHGYVLCEEGTASQGLTPAHCILLIAHVALCKSRLTPAYCISLIVYLTSYTLRLTPYTLRLTSYTLHLTSFTLCLTPYTLHLTPYTLHLTPYILHLTSYIILYHILYRVTCIRLVCKTYPWADASTIRQKL